MASSKQKPILLRIDGELRDLASQYQETAVVEEVGENAESALDVYRHSAAHLLAHAVTELYPGVQYGIGPALETGFYYDFITPHPFTPEDLEQISKKMKHLAKQNIPIHREIWDRARAIEFFQSVNQSLKVELIEEKVDSEEVTVYKQGDFVDLCRGPHLPSTGFLKHFKLLSVAAAYWRGDEKNASMQRIYGVVFPTAEQLAAHLQFLKEAKQRDHRKLGQDLDLFSIQNEIGAGLVLWHPKGSVIRHEIEQFWKESHIRGGYQLLHTPHIARIGLWETSGHTDFYSENMFSPIEFDNTRYQLKPMNCPFHIVVYRSRNRSYREMPLRWAELGTVYRYERSGVLHGLMRVRGFTQDDAHIFCTPEQLDDEVDNLLRFSLEMLRDFGFHDLNVFLSTRPENFVGEVSDWDMATNALERALKESGIPFDVDPGEGVFYGPKIDVKVKDVLNRSWQCSTIQVDFNLPKKFNLKYSNDQGKIQQPIVIHRAILGSLERFFGVLIEHYGGFFPLWLSPIQVIVIPITDRNTAYANHVGELLREAGVRVVMEARSEAIGKKIRDAEIQKIPYIIIVGDDEEKEKVISYRIHKQGDKGKTSLEKFIKGVKTIIAKKGLDYEI